jgi:hypothetical protein
MDSFFKILEKILKFVGEISMPWKKKLLKAKEIRKVMNLAEPMDTILVTAEGEATNLLFRLLPGKLGFTHSALFVTDELISDATRIGVDDRDMLEILIGYCRAALLRPRLTQEEKNRAFERYQEISKLDKKDNIEYNYNLIRLEVRQDGAPEKTTCSQYIRGIYSAGRENFIELKNPFSFIPIKFFERFKTVSPNDLYDLDKFDLIYDSEIDRGNKNG